MSGERLTFQGAFEVTVPAGWAHEEDEDGGLLLAGEDGVGLLHLAAFEDDGDTDPAEELYAFLDEQGIELEEDEVEDLDLEGGGELAYCEYLTEEDEEDPASEGEAATYWLVGVAIGAGRLVFCSYSCPAGEQERERQAVLDALGTLRLLPGG